VGIEMTELYSIGSGNEDLQSFIKRLKKWNINFLVDLRSQPYSSYVPHFNRERLSKSLKKAKIHYLYFGDKLGGRPPEGFEKFLDSPRFNENIDLLLTKVEGKVAALMCTEFDISKCHRRFILAEIIKKGINVSVIDKEGNTTKYLLDFSPKKSKHQKTVTDSKNQRKLTGYLQGGEKLHE
jgi:uncharacterized protein (DUF488 family)